MQGEREEDNKSVRDLDKEREREKEKGTERGVDDSCKQL